MSSKKILRVTGLILFLLIAGCSEQTSQSSDQEYVDESQPHGHSDGDAHE